MWTNIIHRLRRSGLTQAQIADLVGCSQPTIHRLLHGKTQNPGFQVGQRLLALIYDATVSQADLRPDIFGPHDAAPGTEATKPAQPPLHRRNHDHE